MIEISLLSPHILTRTTGRRIIDHVMRLRRIRNETTETQGYPLTAQRKLLLQVIHEAEGYLDAKELYKRASSRDASISPATVYRSLNLFKELGLVDERKLGKTRRYYEAKKSPQHHHMVCRGCDRVIDFESPLINELVEQVRRDYNFNVATAELYLEGFCSECDRGGGNGDNSGH